ncbi:MAG: hypothetical protein EXQ86_09035 [Rhodospirillales bacterium]|nr:hypothetical protein [Rhodospirillales bacterium]
MLELVSVYEGWKALDVCTLEAVQEADIGRFAGIITIEDSSIERPFRAESGGPQQLVLRFDDVVRPIDGFIPPTVGHLKKAFAFAERAKGGPLLIHCHQGTSRSPAVALAVLADRYGRGNEETAVRDLLKIASWADPNRLVVKLADEVLRRDGALIRVVNEAFTPRS